MTAEECIKLLTLLAENKVKYNVDYLYRKRFKTANVNLSITKFFYTYVLNEQLYYIIAEYYNELVRDCGCEYETESLYLRFYKSRFNKFIYKPTDEDIKLIDLFEVHTENTEENMDSEGDWSTKDHKMLRKIGGLLNSLEEPAISISNIIETIENN